MYLNFYTMSKIEGFIEACVLPHIWGNGMLDYWNVVNIPIVQYSIIPGGAKPLFPNLDVFANIS